jgi:DNA-binding beta-propeller fold protein YncE
VTDLGNGRVQGFHTSGAFMISIGGPGDGPGQMRSPVSIALDDEGHLYVAGRDDASIHKFDTYGKFFRRWSDDSTGRFAHGMRALAVDATGGVVVSEVDGSLAGSRLVQLSPEGEFNGTFSLGRPEGVAIAPEGVVHVVDTRSDDVARFTLDGQALDRLTLPGLPEATGAVAIDERGLYVGARSYIYVYSTDGLTLLGAWPSVAPGDGLDDDINPADIALHGDEIYVAASDHRVLVFTREGEFVRQWGGEGSAPGELKDPFGIAVDADGFVYVADQSNHRIQKFSREGEFITQFGVHGGGPGQLIFPSDVAVNAHGNVYVADSDNGRVQIFAPVVAER